MKCYFIQDSIVIKVRRNPTLKFVICHAHVCTVHSCTHPTEKQCCKHLIQKEVNGDVGQGQGVKTYIKKMCPTLSVDTHVSLIETKPSLFKDPTVIFRQSKPSQLTYYLGCWAISDFKSGSVVLQEEKKGRNTLKKLQMNSIGVMKFSRSHRFKT